MENLDLKLDPLNPPKYCPQCQRNGVKSKVKKFKVDPTSTDLVIMCKNEKCPWPFSVAAPEEVTVKEDSKTSNTGKKRKKDKGRLSDITDPNDSLEAPESKEVTDKCKSPNNKKLKLTADEGEEKSETITSDIQDPLPQQEPFVSKDTKQKRRTSREKDVLNYLDKTHEQNKFNMDELDFEPDESPYTENNEHGENAKENKTKSISTVALNDTSEEAKTRTSSSMSDSLVFTAVPVAVRQPLRLPRHAANILSSRNVETEVSDKDDDQSHTDPVNLDSDVEYSFISDESDSELESLASECSTMSAVSENSSVGAGEESEGAGKKKRRGRKKKRKNRRKAHAGKCSKEQHRVSDLAILSQSSTEKVEGARDRNNSREKLEVAPKPTPELLKDGTDWTNISDSKADVTKQNKDLEVPMVQLQNAVFQEVMSSDESSPIKPALPPTPMILTPAFDKKEEVQPVANMSVTPEKTPVSAMSIESTSSDKGIIKPPPPTMSISPEELPPSPGAPSPQLSDSDSDLEMSDLSNFQLKWGEVTPLSPMSVTETDNDLDKDRGKSTPKIRGGKIHIPNKGQTMERKGLKVILPYSGMNQDNNKEKKGESPLHDVQKNSGNEYNLGKTSLSKSHHEALQKEETVTVTKQTNECQVFKEPPKPKPSPARPISHPSPGYSSFPSPNYTSHKYLSLPNLLSPMPATPKSHHEEEDQLLENEKVDVITNKNFDASNTTWKKQSEEKENLSTPNDLENIDRNKNQEADSDSSSSEKTSATEKPDTRKQGLPDGPYPRRRGRKSTAKKFVSYDEYDSSNTSDSQSFSPNIMKPPETPPKRGRGRPPKLKTPEMHKEASTSDSISPITKPINTPPASPINKQITPNNLKLGVPKVIKLVNGKSLPPGLVPCAPPPGTKLVPCAPPNKLSSKMPKESMFDIEVTETDILDKVQKALKIQNKNQTEKNQNVVDNSQSKLENIEKTVEKVDTAIQEEESQLVKPGKTFQRKPKQKQGTSIPSLSNKLYLNTGLDIEATILPHETSIDLPTLSLANFDTEDPDFAVVRKLGSGISLDTELGCLDSKEATMEASITLPEAKNDNAVVFHVANQAMINQPTDNDNLGIKEQGDTRVLLTASSNQIEVHDLKKQNLRYNQTIPCRGRGRGRGKAPLMMRQDSRFRSESDFGDGWFMWRDWKVDQEFIKGFADYMTNLVKKHKLPETSRMDPRIAALLKEKEISTDKQQPTVQKVITFFAEVYVKYLYINQNFFSIMTPPKVMNILRQHFALDNAQFSSQIVLIIQQMQEQGTLVVNRGTQASPPRAIQDHEYGQQPPPQSQIVYQQQSTLHQSLNHPNYQSQVAPCQPVSQVRTVSARPLQTANIQPIPLSESVKAKMIKSALETSHSEGLAGRITQMHQHSQSLNTNQTAKSTRPPAAHSHSSTTQHIPPPSPSQPINLSRSADETSLPPSPTAPVTTSEPIPSSHAKSKEDDYPNHPSIISINPPSVDSTVRNQKSASHCLSDITIKTEPEGEQPPATPMAPPSQIPGANQASVAPSSIMVSSVYNDGGCSVQLASVCPTTPGEAVGQGPKVLQFFYQNPIDDIKIGFPPVRVTTDEEVNCVVALVTEKAEEYNRRNNLAHKGKPVQYYSSAMQARSILDQDIVRHIEKCFTKKGMKESKTGRKKRHYPKRKDIIKVPSDYFKVKQEQVDDETELYEELEEEEEEEEEVVDDVLEYVPSELEMKSTLEQKVFGGQMPLSVRKSKPPRKGISDRTGRGGRNENVKKNAPETLVLGAIDYMLGNKIAEETDNPATINLSSLFKKRGRKKKKRMDVDAFSDEDNYKAPNSKIVYRTDTEGPRKSRRINMKFEGDELEVISNTETNEAVSNSEKAHINENAPIDESLDTSLQKKQETGQENEDREKKLKQVESILISSIPQSKPGIPEKTSEHNFTEPDSSSEDEVHRTGKNKRGHKLTRTGSRADDQAVHSQIDEMIRCASRNSRPGSQASSRPSSQMSRPGSTLPKKVAKQLDNIGSPERDSPVLAPRQRHKEARRKETGITNLTSRKSTPIPPKSPINSTLINENYLRKVESNAASTNNLPDKIGNFDQAYTRKKQSIKIQKLLEKQKKKAEKISNKKYKGFGEKVNPEEESLKKKEEKEQKKRDNIVKKAQVSKTEIDLMKELLKIGETAVAEAKSKPLERIKSVQEKTPTDNLIEEFEEIQTLDDSCPSSQNLSEELDSLFELK